MLLLIRWLINTAALFAADYVLDGIHAESLVVLAIAAAVLGLLNAMVRPILFFLTLPLTILTLGLFILVLNGVMLALTALLVPGFSINTFFDAVLGALILSVIAFFTSWIGRERKSR